MYSSTSPSVKSVVLDNQIRLPRFQRKKTWKDEDRFELCISLFKGYPLGTIVIKKDEINGKTTKWLLDGRQRKDTLVEMQNPETVYRWAKKYLGLKNSFTADEIASRFRRKLDDYIQYEKEADDEPEDSEEDGIDFDTTPCASEPDLSPGLRDLLEIICSVHPARAKNSEFGKPFLFEGYKAHYIRTDSETGRKYVDGDRLCKWLGSKVDNVDPDTLDADEVLDWFDNADDNLRRSIEKNIGGIRRSVRTLRMINDRMNNAPILMIELDSTCESADSRKIFEIINTKGSPLTGAEILSAKPDWNDLVDTDDEDLRKHIDDLYRALEVEVHDVVKWDIAATFTDSITPDAGFILGDVVRIGFKDCRSGDKFFEQKMTAGFKLLSGRYLNSLTKNDIDSLPRKLDKEGGWAHIELQSEIAGICRILLADSGFSKFARSGMSLWDLLSNAIAMNFLFMVIKKWISLGRPQSKGNGTRQLVSYARTLFDRMFFEYSTGVWRGASDSRLTRNLEGAGSDPAFDRVPDESWDAVIDSLYSDNRINSQPVAFKTCKALLYYFTTVRGDLDLGERYEVDHIIPKGRTVGSNPDADSLDSMINLALIPKDLNEKKKDKNISSLDPDSAKRICDFEDLDQNGITDIIANADFAALENMRVEKGLIERIKKGRREFVSCTGYWSMD